MEGSFPTEKEVWCPAEAGRIIGDERSWHNPAPEEGDE